MKSDRFHDGASILINRPSWSRPKACGLCWHRRGRCSISLPVASEIDRFVEEDGEIVQPAPRSNPMPDLSCCRMSNPRPLSCAATQL